MVMMDELLDIINNIINNLFTKTRRGKSRTAGFAGNFVFDKNVLAVTQNSKMKKLLQLKEEEEQGLNMEQRMKGNDLLSTELISRMSRQKLIGTPSSTFRRKIANAKKVKEGGEQRNTVAFLLRN